MSDLKDTKFAGILKRSNRDIKDSRAMNIIEDAEMIYKRTVENLEKDLRVLKREREGMLDLSPGNTYSLKMEAFDADLFVKKYQDLGIQIRDMDIKLQVARESYNDLFGDNTPKIDKPEVAVS